MLPPRIVRNDSCLRQQRRSAGGALMPECVWPERIPADRIEDRGDSWPRPPPGRPDLSCIRPLSRPCPIRPQAGAATLHDPHRTKLLILQLLADGQSAEAIAGRLRVPVASVRSQVRNLLRELAAHPDGAAGSDDEDGGG